MEVVPPAPPRQPATPGWKGAHADRAFEGVDDGGPVDPVLTGTGGGLHSRPEPPEDPGGDAEGTRIGRYVLIRDQEGCLHALSSSAVAGLRECDDGSLLLLTGGRMLQLAHPMMRVLRWFAL